MVTAVNNASGTGGTTTNNTSRNLNNVNFDTFLQMLTAQLKNQDPLNPLDGTQFTGQLAQFSSVEQQIASNEYLKTLVEKSTSGDLVQGASYLGKDVLIPGRQGEEVSLGASGSAVFGYSMSKPIGSDVDLRNVEITLVDEDNKIVKTWDLKNSAEGRYTMNWDGKGDDGVRLPEGKYRLYVDAFDVNGKKVPANGMTIGTVNAVMQEGGQTFLSTTDNRQALVSDVAGLIQK